MNPIRVCLLLALTASLPGPAHGQAGTGTIRVATTGSDTVGCGSTAAPCASLQYAVDQFALPGSGTILVAAGTYTSPDPNRIVRITRRQITMRGGYDATFAASDPTANPVIVDGQNARKGFLVDCPVASPDPCVLTLEAVTITNCSTPPDPGLRDAFGGALDAYLATIELTDVVVTGNRARGVDASSGVPGGGSGGGLSFRSTNATLTRVRVENNLAEGGVGTGSAQRGGLAVGGGIFSYESTVAMHDVTASGNVAHAGAAVSSSGFSAGGQRSDGLGGFWALIYGAATVDGLRAFDNEATGGVVNAAGGLGLGGAIFFQFVTSASLSGALLHDNAALGGQGDANLGGGGALFAEDAHVQIRDSELVANLAQGAPATGFGGTGGGGGIYMNSVAAQDTSVTATNTIIAGNAAVGAAGSPVGYAFGGGLFLQCPQSSCGAPVSTTNDAILVHVTLADNSVSQGAYNQGAAVYSNRFTSVNAAYSIVSGHATPFTPGFYAGEAVLAAGATAFASTLWHDNTTKAFTAYEGAFEDSDPYVGSPAFVDAGGSPPNYRILAPSAARDLAVGSGTPADLDGEARPSVDTGLADLGADEFVTVPEPSGELAGLLASAAVAVAGRRRLRRVR